MIKTEPRIKTELRELQDGKSLFMPCSVGRSNLTCGNKLLLSYFLSLDLLPIPYTPSAKAVALLLGISERSYLNYRKKLVGMNLISFDGDKFKINYEHQILNNEDMEENTSEKI